MSLKLTALILDFALVVILIITGLYWAVWEHEFIKALLAGIYVELMHINMRLRKRVSINFTISLRQS